MKPLSQREERNDETVNVQTTRCHWFHLETLRNVHSALHRDTHSCGRLSQTESTNPGVSVPHAELWVLSSQQEALGVTRVALRDL